MKGTRSRFGPAALKLIEENEADIDLIVLDIMLPGMSGYTVCETLRDRGSDVPVLILSARTLSEDRTRGFDVGANQYLSKQPSRRLVVLISDGDDNNSRKSLEEAMLIAQKSEVAIYAISTNLSIGSSGADRPCWRAIACRSSSTATLRREILVRSRVRRLPAI